MWNWGYGVCGIEAFWVGVWLIPSPILYKILTHSFIPPPSLLNSFHHTPGKIGHHNKLFYCSPFIQSLTIHSSSLLQPFPSLTSFVFSFITYKYVSAFSSISSSHFLKIFPFYSSTNLIPQLRHFCLLSPVRYT